MDKIFYDGWELEYFDRAINFRNYQFDILKKYIKGIVAEVGPGNGSFLKGIFVYWTYLQRRTCIRVCDCHGRA